MTKKVLIMEDEAIVAMSLSRSLPRCGFEVCRVLASGEDALEWISKANPDLILMDIHLLGALDGIQTAERIRAVHKIPIVFMTGYDINEIQRKTQHLTNVGHVGKPVSIGTLVQALENALAEAQT